MPGLVPGIHIFRASIKAWMAATSAAMTDRFGQAEARERTLMNLGFVGLGVMGQGIVPRLIAAGHKVTGLSLIHI